VGIGLAQDAEKMKSLMAFKKRLEEQLEKLAAESKEIQAALDSVNGILLEKGFKRGDMKEAVETPALPKLEEVVLPKPEPQVPTVTVQQAPQASTPTPHVPERESVIPLRTMAEESLAIIYFDKQGMHVLPDESKNFSVNTPPFQNFLVEKVFAKMQEKDKELARTKQLPTERVFSYDILREGDLIREIIIRNVDDERLKELKSSIRWTLEKMHEKTKGA
jgi:hypothetical protein